MLPVSAVTTLATWQADQTTAGEIEDAITGLRRQEIRAAVRMAVLTLVALVEQGACDAALETVRDLGARAPTHAIVIEVGDPDAPPQLGADVRVHALERDERAVCFEDIKLMVAGPVVRHLDSLIQPLVLPDLPVVMWLPGRLPDPHDPLFAAADRVVIDTRALDAPAVFSDLLSLVRRVAIADLSWVRLAPWRELMAGLFEGAPFRPFVNGVRHVRVAGKAGPRHLLAGWLISRLGVAPSQVTLEDRSHVTIEIEAEVDGTPGRFVVARPGDDRIVDATVSVEGGPSHSRTLRLRERDPSRVLAEALARPGHDRVWEQALAAAASLI